MYTKIKIRVSFFFEHIISNILSVVLITSRFTVIYMLSHTNIAIERVNKTPEILLYNSAPAELRR